MFKIIFSDLLQKNEISQAKLSKDTGIPEGTISRWKDGIQFPSYKYINILCDYFKVSADYLLERKKEQEENTYIANQGEVQGNNTQNINTKYNDNDLSYLEMELIQEIKKLTKTEQIRLLAELNEPIEQDIKIVASPSRPELPKVSQKNIEDAKKILQELDKEQE